MPFLELSGVGKSFGGGAPVLRDVNLAMERGEFVAIVGYSGSGKTTLISMIAGLIAPDCGTIKLNDLEVTAPGPDRGVVFQNYSLLPWLTVHENIALAVDQVFPNWSAEKKRQHIERHIAMVNLAPARDKLPRQLSGGMRQRVSVARALAIDPQILLLDEPLSALDALTRATLQEEIERIWEADHKTVILITNDVDEGLLLADRIIPLTPGPGATLGESIPVPLSRPRDRKALNHDPEFKRLRAQVTNRLLDLGADRKTTLAVKRELPDILPKEPVRPARSSFLELSQLTKAYPGPRGPAVIVENFTLSMPKGEFVSLIGHSGCGKSTVLSMVAGLTEATSGGVILTGREVTGAGPDRGVVFQSPCLLPWLTAFENVMLGVDQVFPAASPEERRLVAEYYLAVVGLAEARDQKPSELSQGMRQRCGIARAFALAPKMLLLDEPFGMLDSLTRYELQEVLLELWQKDHKTALMVTHDVDEALFLSDRIVMMTNGPAATVGEILEVPFPRPRSRQQLLEDPEYYRLRERLIGFLEERSSHRHQHEEHQPKPRPPAPHHGGPSPARAVCAAAARGPVPGIHQ